MKAITCSEFKANFSLVVDELKRGNEVILTYGRNKEPIATIVPRIKVKNDDYSVKIGDLKEMGWNFELNHFEMTEEELLTPSSDI